MIHHEETPQQALDRVYEISQHLLQHACDMADEIGSPDARAIYWQRLYDAAERHLDKLRRRLGGEQARSIRELSRRAQEAQRSPAATGSG